MLDCDKNVGPRVNSTQMIAIIGQAEGGRLSARYLREAPRARGRSERLVSTAPEFGC